MTDPWSVRQNGDGWQVYYHDRPWVGAPRPSEEEAKAYADRLRERYPNGADCLMPAPDENDTGRQRGGPWRYTYPDGEGEATDVIHTARLSDAKDVLRHNLRRKRLPNGIEWSIAESP